MGRRRARSLLPRPGLYREAAPRRSRRSADGLPRAEAIGIDAPGYPAALASIPSPPKLLWVRGTLPPPAAVAVVGTRNPTAFGREVAEIAARGATKAGLGVISGLAA